MGWVGAGRGAGGSVGDEELLVDADDVGLQVVGGLDVGDFLVVGLGDEGEGFAGLDDVLDASLRGGFGGGGLR